jgi:hypothetical protein
MPVLMKLLEDQFFGQIFFQIFFQSFGGEIQERVVTCLSAILDQSRHDSFALLLLFLLLLLLSCDWHRLTLLDSAHAFKAVDREPYLFQKSLCGLATGHRYVEADEYRRLKQRYRRMHSQH